MLEIKTNEFQGIKEKYEMDIEELKQLIIDDLIRSHKERAFTDQEDFEEALTEFTEITLSNHCKDESVKDVKDEIRSKILKGGK